MAILVGLLLAIGIQVGTLLFAGEAPGLTETTSPKNLRAQKPVAVASSGSYDLLGQSFLTAAPEVPTSKQHKPKHKAYAFRMANQSLTPTPDNLKRLASQKPQNEAEKPRQAPQEPINVLVLGVDRRASSVDTGTRSDTIMIVQVEPSTGRIKLLSIPRDLLCDIAPGWQDRINAAYAYYGVAGAKEAVEDVTGIRIDNYAVVDFEGFRGVVDAMGGVKVEVKEGVFPPQQNMREGVQKLNGRKALFYARYRGAPGGDLARMERQQQLVAALRSQMLDQDTLTKLPEIIRVMNENIETDMGVRETVSLGRILVQQQSNTRMTTAQLKGSAATMSNGNQVLVPDMKANEAVLESFR